MGYGYTTSLPVAKQHGQAICGLHGTDHPLRCRIVGIGPKQVGRGCRKADHLRAVALLQPRGFARKVQYITQEPPVFCDVLWMVSDMRAQIEARITALAAPTVARRRYPVYAFGSRPVRLDPLRAPAWTCPASVSRSWWKILWHGCRPLTSSRILRMRDFEMARMQSLAGKARQRPGNGIPP